MISFGGWTWNNGTADIRSCKYFSAMASTAASRSTFIREAMQYARVMKFDGT
jgi:GH18 family chitinase